MQRRPPRPHRRRAARTSATPPTAAATGSPRAGGHAGLLDREHRLPLRGGRRPPTPPDSGLDARHRGGDPSRRRRRLPPPQRQLGHPGDGLRRRRGSWSGRECSTRSTPPPTGAAVRTLAEATLAVVLFADASRIDLRTLRREYAVPARLLGIGLPLTIALGGRSPRLLFGAALRHRGAGPRGRARAHRRRARPGRRHRAAAAVSDPPGPQRRERPQRRDLRSAAVHRAGDRGGRRRTRVGHHALALVVEEIGFGIARRRRRGRSSPPTVADRRQPAG